MNISSTILSGYQVLEDVGYLIDKTQKVLLVTDNNIVSLPVAAKFISHIQQIAQDVTIINDVPAEPSDHDVEALLTRLPHHAFDLIIGLGGGSVLDVAKLLSVLAIDNKNANLQQLLSGEKPVKRCRSILIPTTAGTGSEATPNAILAILEKSTKVGIISPILLPDYVFLVPELTTSMPAHIAASTGIDALCHLIECLTSNIANPISDNYALTGLAKLLPNIDTVVNQPNNLAARLEMLWASYYGGAAIAHSGTHLVHAMSYPLGGKYHIPHGVANAILLAPCMRFIQQVAAEKLARVYALLPTANPSLTDEQKAEALVNYFYSLVSGLGLPTTLNQLNIPDSDLPYLVDAALDVQRLMKNVPRTVSREDVVAIYQSLS